MAPIFLEHPSAKQGEAASSRLLRSHISLMRVDACRWSKSAYIILNGTELDVALTMRWSAPERVRHRILTGCRFHTDPIDLESSVRQCLKKLALDMSHEPDLIRRMAMGASGPAL